jgi:cytochrome b6-f complex iron-sulfur subunit
MSTVNRRQFVAAGVAACACATCPALRALAEAAAEKAAPVDVGPLEDFKARGIHDPGGAGRRFFLVRRGGRLYAVSSTCTHKKVKLVAQGDTLKCPRHGSAFTAEGRVTRSPARKPLPRYGIRLDDRGHVLVDTSVVFGADAWDDAACFVAVDSEK